LRQIDNVELLCDLADATGWGINTRQYGLNALLNGILAGHSSNGTNIIVENIIMNDGRNGSHYRCAITLTGVVTNEDNPTFLCVASKYITCTFNNTTISLVIT